MQKRLASAASAMKPAYDVVVIGSGYGGGVAASRLARAGKSVCVIERGREIVTGEFPARLPELRRELQIRGGKMGAGPGTGLYDFRLGEDIHVLVGCGLGGGSLINAAVALQPEARVFADPAWPQEIRRDGLLAEGFARARAVLRPSRHGKAAEITKFRSLQRLGEALGQPPVATPVVVNFEAGTNWAGLDQPACELCGDCCSGCNVGAKNTVAMTYLPDARAHGAELFTELGVSHVTKEEGAWRIHFAPAGKTDLGAAPSSVLAQDVVLAAGTLGSTEILLRSAENGLAVSDRLGEGFSANGDIIAFALGKDVRVNAIGVGTPPKFVGDAVGACVTGQIEIVDQDRLDHSMTIQEGVLPSALAPLLPVFFISGGRLLGAAQSLVKGVYQGPLSHLHTFFVVSHDRALGKMTLEKGELKLRWPGVAEEPVYARVDAALTEAAQSVGARYIKHPLAATGAKPATAHPLGGCGMGEDAASGVVNHKGQVFAGASGGEVHRGLYVCDGAIIPRSIGCNPLLTITALAERAMAIYAADHGLAGEAGLAQSAA